jgi:hypothetical protein
MRDGRTASGSSNPCTKKERNMLEDENLKSLLKEALLEMKAEIREELKGEIAIVTASASDDSHVAHSGSEQFVDRKNPPVFDPTKPRSVWRKIRCAEPPSGRSLLPAPGETQSSTGSDEEESVCGRVYNRIIQYPDNPHQVDLMATSNFCPKCGGTKWEELARFKQHGPNSPNVTILKSRKNT